MYCIYKLTGENGLVYYGSTQNYKKRIGQHKSLNRPDNESTAQKLKRKFRAEIIEDGIPHLNIAIVREGYYIRNFPCVNRHNPDNWFKKSRREVNQKWYRKNKDERHKYEKQYREWRKTWGGCGRTKSGENNLLAISIDAFS